MSFGRELGLAVFLVATERVRYLWVCEVAQLPSAPEGIAESDTVSEIDDQA